MFYLIEENLREISREDLKKADKQVVKSIFLWNLPLFFVKMLSLSIKGKGQKR